MAARISLLGTVELRINGQPSALGSAKERLLLAALALDVGQMISTGTLVDRIWDAPSARAGANLHVLVSRVRRALLGQPDGEPVVTLHSQAHTYRLDAPPEAIDVHQYRRLTEQARTLAEHGRLPRARAVLQEASALWRGEPLAGLDGLWAQRTREALTQRHLYLMLTRAGIALRQRDFGEAIIELSPLAAQYPTDESLAEHLAVAYHGAGRTPEADQVVERTLGALRLALGTGLNPRLRRVRRAFAEGRPVEELLAALGYLAPPRPSPAQPAQPAQATPDRLAVPDDLPPDIDWVGRETESHDLLTATDRATARRDHAATVLGIDGMPGVGKTALAVHVAHRVKDRYPDGRLLIDLRGHDHEQAPLSTLRALTELLRRMGVPAEQIPDDEEHAVTVWRTFMSTRRVLLVLDNASGPAQALPLLPSGAGSLVLITSRRRLAALPGIHSHSLDVLSEREAISLFQDRIQGRRSADPSDIASIARLLGYLPLALDIVAIRFLTRPTWTIADLAARLSRGPGIIREIRDGSREFARAVAMSYEALSDPEQLVFRHLGLLVGPEFDPYAVAALTGLPLDEVQDGLEGLFYVHLVRESASQRFVLHDLLREFARALARELPPAVSRTAVDRLTDVYLHTADRADRLAHPHRARIELPARAPDELDDWLDESAPQGWFQTESGNLLALGEHLRNSGDSRRAALLTHVLVGFLEAEGQHLMAADAPLRAAVHYWRAQGLPGAEARALLDLSTAVSHTGRYPDSVAIADRARTLAERHGDHEVEMEALQHLALAHHFAGQQREALLLMDRLMPLRQRAADLRQQTRSRNLLGAIQHQLGNNGAALQTLREALSGFRVINDTRGQYMALNNMAEILREMHRPEESIAAFRQAIALAEKGGRPHEEMLLKMNLAEALLESGDSAAALPLYRDALPFFRSLEQTQNESAALVGIGLTLSAQGHPEEAIPHILTALRLARSIGAGIEESRALRELGRAELRAHLPERAADHLHESLTVARRLRLAAEEVRTATALAETLTAQGEVEQAATWLARARTLAERIGLHSE